MDQSAFYIIALIAVCLVLLSIALMTMYLKLLDKYEELKLGKERNVDPDTLVAQARARSQQILEEAQKKAQEVIAQAGVFMKREESVMGKELDNFHKTLKGSYDEAIKTSEEKAVQMIQNIPQDIKVTLISVIDNFRVTLSKEITKTQEDANKTIREAYQKAAEEVNKYKEERMKQVDSSILSVVKEVTEKVIGKSVSTEEHEKLVIKALEEAKRQKIL